MLKLSSMKIVIDSSAGKKLRMRADFADSAVAHCDNLVGVAYCR